jgi:hypothetical protein
MTKKTIWAQRIAEWRGSGQTSLKYCEGRGFTAGALRHWAHRLGESQARKAEQVKVRMARVVTATESGARSTKVSGRDPGERVEAALIVEVGTARISVQPGFDHATLAAVLEVLTTQRREAR